MYIFYHTHVEETPQQKKKPEIFTIRPLQIFKFHTNTGIQINSQQVWESLGASKASGVSVIANTPLSLDP